MFFFIFYPLFKFWIVNLRYNDSLLRYLKSEDHLCNAHLEGNIKTSTTEPWERLHAGNKIASFDPELNTFRGTALYSAGDMSRQQIGI